MCPYCEKTFKTNVNCKKHMKTHIGSLTAQNPIGSYLRVSNLFLLISIVKVLVKVLGSVLLLSHLSPFFRLRKIPTRCNYRESGQPP